MGVLGWCLLVAGVSGVWLLAIVVLLSFVRMSKAEEALEERLYDKKQLDELLSALNEEELIRVGHRFKLRGNLAMTKLLADCLLKTKK